MTTHSSGVDFTERTFTRRQFMIYETLIRKAEENEGASIVDSSIATEAVASWAIENPDVDMEEEMTWAEWQEQGE